MKLLNIVILILVISSACAIPGSRWMMNRGKKSKRGIFGEGFIGGGGGIHGLSLSIPASGIGLPFAFHQKPYVPSVYSKFPSAGYAFTHGDASVQSFQINYPKYNYVQQKPIIAQPVPFPIAASFTPQLHPQIFQGFAGVALGHHDHGQHHAPVAPIPAQINPTLSTPTHVAPPVTHGPVLPVAATPTFFLHQKPIVPVAIPAPIIPKPVVFTKPVAQHPVFTIAALTPQFVSIPYPTESPTANPPTTINTASATPTNEPPSTQQPNPDGQPGTNFVTNVNPDQQSWQPMFIGSTNHFLPTPTTPTTQNVPRPPISLLPPYLGPTGPGFDSNTNTFFITTTNSGTGNSNNNDNNNEPQSNQSENNFNNINPMNNIHTNNNGNDFGQGGGGGGYETQQSHNINNINNNNYNNNNHHHHSHHRGSHSHNQNQHRNHHNVNQQGYGPFNGQGYDAPSNSGRYIGPSSYQVGLRTRIN